MVKDHSDSERGNPLPPHGLLFPISSRDYFICTIPHDFRQDCTYHGLCYTSRGVLAGTRNSSTDRTMKDRSDDLSHNEYHHTTAFVIPVVEYLLEREIC